MTTNKLYDLAETQNISIYDFHLPLNKSISYVDEKSNCYIAIDEQAIEGEIDEKEKLAHELGHCMRHAFYNRYSPCDVIGRHEYRANVWAVSTLLPSYRLRGALHLYREYWQLAELFGLSEDFIKMAS